ncbi:MAG: FAD-dependent oxidoreductase [Cyanobacteria bacterium J06628_6]
MDVTIIGAGLAGITCARALQTAGHRVVLLDKSRGVGGRIATRRLHGTHADHGFRVWAPQHPGLQTLTQELVTEGILQSWAAGYAAKDGGNAIAKYLAADLTIRRQHRVVRLEPVGPTWRIWSAVPETEEPQPLESPHVVLTIPAPQAADLLEASGYAEIAPLRAVEYAPCVTVMAGYHGAMAGWPAHQQTVSPSNSPLLWMGLDSSKRDAAAPTVVVMHSTAAFATQTLATDRNQLQPAATELIQAAAALIPGLATPDWWQVHRWRYAFVTHPCLQPFVLLPMHSAHPLLCGGDWCQPNGFKNLDAAYQSGLQLAQQLGRQLG